MTSLPSNSTNGDVNGSKHKANVPRDYRPDERVEPIPKADFPHHLYPRWIGHKFNPDGSVLEYAGNTLLSHLDVDSTLHHALLALYDDIQQQDFAHLFTFLPPSSWHMTIYEGISDQIRTRESFPRDLPLHASLKMGHAFVAGRLAEFRHGLEIPIKMSIAGFDPLDDGIALKLEPMTSAGEDALRKLRSRLDEPWQLHHPGHANYSWHMGFAYLLRHFSPEDEQKVSAYLKSWQARLPKEFELGTPEFCVYDNMYQFRRMFFLEA